MKRRFLSILLSIVMIFSTMPVMTAWAGEEGDSSVGHANHCVCGGNISTGGHAHDVIAPTWTTWDGTASFENGGYYYLSGDVTVTETIKVSGADMVVNLCLNGHVLKLETSSSARVIYVEKGATLNLCDCGNTATHTFSVADNGLWVLKEGTAGENDRTVSGGVITGGTSSGIYVSKSRLNMYGGNITGNSVVSSSSQYGGGGVCFYESVGSGEITDGGFLMYGGAICGNVSESKYSEGGGIYLHNSVGRMYGGTISDNTATTDNQASGGGVYLSGSGASGTVSQFFMTGGRISNNMAKLGGGVYLSIGTFEMSGGTISGNTATSTSSGGGGVYLKSDKSVFNFSGGIIGGTAEADANISSTNGGGVYVLNGTMNMTGGKISGNQTEKGGGGIYVVGTLNMSDGEISGNTANSSGGGVYVDSSSDVISVSGAPIVSGNKKGTDNSNIYLSKNAPLLTVEEPLTEGAYLGMSLYDSSNVGRVAEAETDYSQYFVSDSYPDNRKIYYNSAEGKIVIAYVRTVTFNYNDGTDATSSQKLVQNVEEALKSNTYTRRGYEFIGWNTKADGTGTEYTDGQLVTLYSNLTLYAQWEAKPHSHHTCGIINCTDTTHGHEEVTEWKPLSEDTIAGTSFAESNAHYCYYLDEDIKTDTPLYIGSNVLNANISGITFSLCLNGHTLTYTGSDLKGTIILNNGSILNICDCSEGAVHYGQWDEGRTAYTVSDTKPASGEYDTLTGGIITGGKRSGIYVETDSSCAINMYGGNIAGNTDGQNSNVGGGVQLFGSDMNLYGGSVIGNLSSSSNFSRGGGIAIWNGATLKLYEGGRIENNAATGTANFSRGGGGIYLSEGSFYMYGGSVSRNYSATYGGGISLTDDGSKNIKLYGGTISGNTTAGKDGGGIYGSVYDTFNISGDVVIANNKTGGADNNLWLGTSKTVVIDKALAAGANIGITKNGGAGIFAKPDGTIVTDATVYANCFTSDNTDYSVQPDGEKLKLVKNEIHADHPLCGDSNCTAHGETKTWKKLTNADFPNSNKLSLTEGSYYLGEDITGDKTIVIKENVNLCLNGKTFSTGCNESAVQIQMGTNQDLIFNICDCSSGETGVIRQTRDSMRALEAYRGTTNLYGGTLATNSATTVYLFGSGKLNQYGGTLDKAYEHSWTVYLSSTGSTYNLYGGTVKSKTGGTEPTIKNSSGTMSISSAPTIEGSVDIGTGTPITIAGVLTASVPKYSVKWTGNGVFTSGWPTYMSGKAHGDYFVSADPDLSVIVDSATGELKLAVPVTVTFAAGEGGSGTMADVQAEKDSQYTLPSCTFTAPSGKEFKAWSVNGTEYAAGAEVTLSVATTITAVWKDKPSGNAPDIPDLPYIPSTPPTESITVPVSGDQNTIHTDAKVSGSKAVVDEVNFTALDTVIGEDVKTGVVTIDFSGLESSKTINTVEIPADVVKQISDAVNDPANDAESLEIVITDGTSIEFDAEALNQQSETAGGADITITIVHAQAASLSAGQRETVGNNTAYDISIMSGGKHISHMGGKVIIHAPYQLKSGEAPAGLIVYYVAPDGTREACRTSYDPVRQRVNWTTDHLSVYMIEYETERAEEGAAQAEKQALMATVDDIKLVARSRHSRLNGKRAVYVYWYDAGGSDISEIFEGYEVQRSTQRFKGYGKKPFFGTGREKYWNNLDLKSGSTYYYRVRGYVTIDGERYYSDWSLKAWRTIK
ncbi:MAG: InlB B-repeat-containing protein [Firmicutes bacterium]|nr:InlB B-repeat-containing protein [Bacillota bacterium]